MTDTWEHTLTHLATTHPGTRLTLTAVGAGWIAELRVPGVGMYTSTADPDPVRAIGRVVEMYVEVVGLEKKDGHVL